MIKLMNQVGAKSEKELIELIQNGKVSIETTKSFFVMMTQTGAVIVDSTLKRSSSGGANNNNGEGGPGLPGSIGLIGGIVKIGYDYLFGNSDEPKKESGENPEKPVIADEKPWQYKVKPSESKITDDPKPENPDIVIEPGKDEPSIWDKINPLSPDFIFSSDEDKKNDGEAQDANPSKSESNARRASDNELKKRNIDAHELKYDFLGKKAPISQYDIYIDKKSGELLIYRKGMLGNPIHTGEFLPGGD